MMNSVFTLMSMLWVVMVVCWPLAVQAGENLLKNGGFEEADPASGLPAWWSVDVKTRDQVQLSSDCIAGKHSLRIVGGRTMATQAIKVDGGGRAYVAKCWIKTSGNVAGFFSVISFDAGRQMIAQPESQRLSPSCNQANWQLATLKFTSPPGAQSLHLSIHGRGGDGAAWFDGVSLEEAAADGSGVETGKLVFAADFASGQLGTDWKVIDGKWEVKEGALHSVNEGGNSIIICTRTLGRNLRIEYTAWSDNTPCDLSVLMNVKPADKNLFNSGYFFGVGNYNNTKHNIVRQNQELARTNVEGFSTPLSQGRRHHVVAERNGERLRLWLDGKLEVETNDYACAEISGCHFGLYTWNSGFIKDLKVFALPETDGVVLEVKQEVAEHVGFETDKPGEPPGSMKVGTSDGAKVAVVNEPTWIYREDGEEFVKDQCANITASEGGKAVLSKQFAPIASGIVEFDLMARQGGGEARISLVDASGVEAVALVIDKDGTFFADTGKGRVKLEDKIEYRRRWTTPSRFWLQPDRWFTLRLWFDTKAGILRSVGAVDLYREIKSSYTRGVFDQGDYHQFGMELPLKTTAGGIAGVNLTVSGPAVFALDNVCVLGPVGALKANGINLMRPMRVVMGLGFPARKDPLELKIYSLRNVAAKEDFKAKGAQNFCGMSRQRGGEKYKTFALGAAKRYNEALVRQAFAVENAQMLERAATLLDGGFVKEAKDARTIAAAARQTEELLAKAYKSYAHAYLNDLNREELTEKFVPAAAALETALGQTETAVADFWQSLPSEALADKDVFTPCPLPVDTSPIVWKDGQWLRNGKPGFLFDFHNTNFLETAVAQRTSPVVFTAHHFLSSAQPGEFVGNMDGYTKMMKASPELKFNFNMTTGMLALRTYVPKWWIEQNKSDPDVFFSDNDGRPIRFEAVVDTMYGPDCHQAALNFWNPKVKDLQRNLHEGLAAWIANNAPDKVLLINLGWEASQLVPGGWETGHNASAAAAFRKFLQAEYRTIDALNARWETKHASFDDLVSPQRGLPPTGLQYEFQRFRHQCYKDWILFCRQAIREKMPNLPIQHDTLEFMGGMGVQSFDMPRFFEMADIVAFHSYRGKPLKAADRWLDSLRRAYGSKAIGNHEWYSGMCAPEMFDEDNYKRNGLSQLFHRMMWGQSTTSVWGALPTEGNWTYGGMWLEPRLGFSVLQFQAGFAPVHFDRTRRLGGVALSLPSAQPDIGILECTSSYYNALPLDALRRGMQDTAVALEAKGINYGIFYEKLLLEKKQTLDGVQALVVPNGICMPPELSGMLTEWVKNGGKLIAAAPPGVFNQYGRPAGIFLQAAFGEAVWTHKNYGYWKPADGSVKPVETVGKSDLYQHALGKGTVWLFNQPVVSDEMLNRTLELLGKHTARGFFSRANKFDLCLREGQGKRYLYVLNSDLNAAAADEIVVSGTVKMVVDVGLPRPLPVPVRLEAGSSTVKLKLQPGEGTLLELR